MDKKEFGDFGEEIAAEYMKKDGCEIVARNFSCRAGELDIIAKKGRELIFCEVKTRASDAYGYPAEAVNAEKRARVRRAAGYYILTNKAQDMLTRFDVVELYLNHFKGAF